MENEQRKTTVKGARQWLGNLLVAWSIVAGMAGTLGSAWYYRTGDMAILIAYLGAPFLIGTMLFVAIGLVSLAGNVGDRHVTLRAKKGFRRRSSFDRQ